MEFTDEVHWALVFEKGGRLNSFSMGEASTGSWRVEEDELCTTRPPGEPRCHEVWASGRNMQLRAEPAIPDEGIAGGIPILALDMYAHAYHIESGANPTA
jgi:hypothetical protein